MRAAPYLKPTVNSKKKKVSTVKCCEARQS